MSILSPPKAAYLFLHTVFVRCHLKYSRNYTAYFGRTSCKHLDIGLLASASEKDNLELSLFIPQPTVRRWHINSIIPGTDMDSTRSEVGNSHAEALLDLKEFLFTRAYLIGKESLADGMCIGD